MNTSDRKRETSVGWLPHPVLSLVLGGVWLLLQQSLAPVQLLWAGVLALVLPRLAHGFLGDSVRMQAPGTMLHLAGVVLWDILVSNLTVARLALDPRAEPQPAWVQLPLTATDPTALALLATIITITPGTVSCVVDEPRRMLLIHALDCHDAPALVAQIRQRYERPLRRIFEGADA
jgi:multicomponent K+:H+ antiporter subunit E